jgi:hypothetical protein
MQKQCFKCKEVKVLEMFYKHPYMPDGHVNKCKECNKIDNKISNGSVTRTCTECNKDFKTTKNEVNRGGGHTCSRKCYFTRFKKIVKKGEESPNWRGDNVGKEALHKWVIKQLGNKRECSECKTTTAKCYDWANISQEYKRDITDWKRLCRKCHTKFDYPTRIIKWRQSMEKNKKIICINRT